MIGELMMIWRLISRPTLLNDETPNLELLFNKYLRIASAATKVGKSIQLLSFEYQLLLNRSQSLPSIDCFQDLSLNHILNDCPLFADRSFYWTEDEM
jgi:hypothetical protein